MAFPKRDREAVGPVGLAGPPVSSAMAVRAGLVRLVALVGLVGLRCFSVTAVLAVRAGLVRLAGLAGPAGS
jgi:hypothetical protein